jgi:oxygen-independent coproporphyrinogen-3 oxidase
MPVQSTPAPAQRQPPGPAPDPDATDIAAVYLHLPFCFHKCHYCDFFSVVDRAEDRQEAFTTALIAEIEAACKTHPLQPRTLFVGGGTPTYLRPPLWARLLQTLHGCGLMRQVEEFTVEANPETVTPTLMQQLADGGVNRVSIGAQSFQPKSLEVLERWHEPASVVRAVAACRAAGIGNLSLDLIFAIPGQSLAMLDADLDRLLELEPTHLSTYGLTFEPQTPLAARLRLGQVTEVDEATQRQMYGRVLDRLDDAGFEHYEVSNWARRSVAGLDETRCRHNLAYWENHNWLGFGPAAASHVDGRRWRNAPNLTQYVERSPHPPKIDHEELGPDQRIGERFMLGLRLGRGLPREWVTANVKPGDHRDQAIEELADLGMLEWASDRLRLTRRGRFVADSVVAKLL